MSEGASSKGEKRGRSLDNPAGSGHSDKRHKNVEEKLSSSLPENLRQKLVTFLVRKCPEQPNGGSYEFATQIVAAMEAKHGSDHKAIKEHTRSIAHGMERNKSLVNLEPDKIVSLPREQLSSKNIQNLRKKAQLGGWAPPPIMAVSLPENSAWFQAEHASKRLILVFRDPHTVRAYEKYFGHVPRVEVIQHADITTVEGTVDAFVSPANCIGNMDGGIDRAYANYLGWSYGRPYHSPNMLQLAIDRTKGEEGATLPIGEAILVRDEKKTVALIAAPTMALPGKIQVGSKVVYQATRAAFIVWKMTRGLNVVRMPSFGTGYGQVPAEIAAAQTWEGFVSAWSAVG